MVRVLRGRPVVAGPASGEALASAEPLSFWGGYDQRTGEIIDRRHPLAGRIAAGRILALPAARGSSTTTAVLVEAIRAGTAPAALVTDGPDRYFALAAIVAAELFDAVLPVVALDSEDFATLRSGDRVELAPDGTVRITPGSGAP